MVQNSPIPHLKLWKNLYLKMVQQYLLYLVRMGMPQGQVSDIFANITKVNYTIQIADFLKVNIKIEAI